MMREIARRHRLCRCPFRLRHLAVHLVAQQREGESIAAADPSRVGSHYTLYRLICDPQAHPAPAGWGWQIVYARHGASRELRRLAVLRREPAPATPEPPDAPPDPDAPAPASAHPAGERMPHAAAPTWRAA